LRRRFFYIIFAVLIVVTASSVVTHTLFLRNERLAFIDQQVRETASALVDSQLGDLRKIDFEQAESIISEELGETRIGKFFIIRNAKGDVIFQSGSARLLPLVDIPRERRWVQINTKGKFIRVLNLQLPRIPDRTLQVGLVLDETIVSPDYFSVPSATFIAVVLLLGFAASLFLTSFLLKPVAKLESFLTKVASQVKTQPQLPIVPESILGKSVMAPKDEFCRMVAGLNLLIEMVNKNYRFSRLWAYQMAHELKTPLAILGLEVERLQKSAALSDAEVRPIVSEGTRISETINSFLGWAELENTSQRKRLFVNRVGGVVERVSQRFTSSQPGRIHFQLNFNPVVIASPQHVEQVVSNLLSNALSYSPPGTPVTVTVSSQSISISDLGMGIPQDVIDRLGEPFNRGHSERTDIKGHGLGLAWVKSICRLYTWEMKVYANQSGSKIEIVFPAEDQASTLVGDRSHELPV